MPKTLTPAVAYIRMSSGKQEASPAQQRAEIRKLAKQHHYRIVRWYFDEGISGDATEKRAEFQRMITDAEEKRDFCACLVGFHHLGLQVIIDEVALLERSCHVSNPFLLALATPNDHSIGSLVVSCLVPLGGEAPRRAGMSTA